MVKKIDDKILMFDYLKEDEEYQKLLRENKLNRILN
jgi:hypothetical protein